MNEEHMLNFRQVILVSAYGSRLLNTATNDNEANN